ncbi:MAG: DUF58 domain-containing protein [Betaproteobacteria bacterium HGW-Betaproteobacteria-4]|nr:MAG: DUF58 domain-containing protein [Betaproteobacteria bacterium HGW-Betaproteobacteria-4]
MLIGAINYNLALGHALVFLLAGLGVVGMIHTFRNLHGLIVTPGRSGPVFAGETAHFELMLDNDRPTPRLGLELEAESGNPVFATVNRKKSSKLNIPVSSKSRGWLTLPRVRLSTRYPLGLYTAWAYLQPAMRCLVYPQPIAAPLPDSSPTPLGGERSGDGGQEDFAGFRDRQPADSPRHVAWKASARNAGEGPLLIKQFAGGAQVELMLDWQLTDAALSDETRIGILTGWVLAADAADAHYGLRLPGIDIPTGSGERHRQLCLEALALCQP